MEQRQDQVEEKMELGQITPLPHVDISLDFLSGDERPDSLLRLISHIRPGWPKHCIKTKALAGGNINQIVKCWRDDETLCVNGGGTEAEVPNESQNSSPSPADNGALICRIFGPKYENVLDKATYIPTMQALHKFGCCAEVISSFNNGIVYRFTAGVLIHPDKFATQHIRALVARKLASFHSASPNEVLPSHLHVPKTPKFMDGVRRSLSNLPNDTTLLQRDESPLFTRKADLENEFAYVTKLLAPLETDLVMSHGDSWWTNILYHEGDVNFIDCDFSGYNYKAWDLAYFMSFCQTMVEPPTFSCVELSHEDERHFISSYVKAFYRISDPSEAPHLDDKVTKLIEECKLVNLAINLYLTCALYGFASAERKTDFIWFGNQTAQRYIKQKKEYLSRP